MTLKTRRPTGAVPWPLILIEGGEKTGKSYACAALSASQKIGRTLWLDLGEGAADEYGAIPGARYEVIEHDGSWASIVEQVIAAREEAQRAADADEPPVVLILDSITAEWELLKDWASSRAAKTEANRKKLERDPNAEVITTMNLWNDAAARHRRLMATLMTFPGIVVVTARGGEVALVEGGKPVEGKKSYRVEGHKTLAYDATLWLRLSRDAKPTVIGARSVHTGVRPGIDPAQTLQADWTLEWLIFEALRCEPAKAHTRDLVEPKQDDLTPEQIRDEALKTTTTFERIRELHLTAQNLRYGDVMLVNDSGDDENLLAMLVRIGNERRGPATPAANGQPAARPQNGQRPGRPAAQPAAPATPGRAADGDAEARFVATFTVALSNSRTPESLDARGADIRAAKREGVISAEIANELLDQLAGAKRTAAAAA